MYGRYGGNDFLNICLIVLGAVITLLLSLFFYKAPIVRIIGFIPYGLAAFRALSKNHQARLAENRKFMEISAPWRNLIMKKLGQLQDKEHRYYNCPSCKRTLRVPRGKGKIKISCPHCSREFTKKT